MPGSADRDADPPPLVSASPRGSRRGFLIVLMSVVAVGCLVAAGLTGTAAYTTLTRQPTTAERSVAAAVAVAGRWRSWPAGRIFPSKLSYTTSLLTDETAARVGIAPGHDCAEAIDASLARAAARLGCDAGLRATYADQLQGIVVTIGVLAFPDQAAARRFLASLPSATHAPIPLRALALPGTVSARFSDAAREASTAGGDGPFVILSTAGYADGRPAASQGQPRQPIFAPAAQLATEVGAPLRAPVRVNCDPRYWSC